MTQSVILIGPMGAGKSAIGRQLARRLELPFHDTDDAIRERTGVDIPFIFDLEGEAGFRRREEAVLKTLLEGGQAVISTGGGIILSADNRTLMREKGVVVFLETSVDWQWSRTRRGRQRPLLDTEDPRAKLETLYRIRKPLYEETAHVTVETDGRRVPAVAASIVNTLKTVTEQSG